MWTRRQAIEIGARYGRRYAPKKLGFDTIPSWGRRSTQEQQQVPLERVTAPPKGPRIDAPQLHRSQTSEQAEARDDNEHESNEAAYYHHRDANGSPSQAFRNVNHMSTKREHPLASDPLKGRTISGIDRFGRARDQLESPRVDLVSQAGPAAAYYSDLSAPHGSRDQIYAPDKCCDEEEGISSSHEKLRRYIERLVEDCVSRMSRDFAGGFPGGAGFSPDSPPPLDYQRPAGDEPPPFKGRPEPGGSMTGRDDMTETRWNSLLNERKGAHDQLPGAHIGHVYGTTSDEQRAAKRRHQKDPTRLAQDRAAFEAQVSRIQCRPFAEVCKPAADIGEAFSYGVHDPVRPLPVPRSIAADSNSPAIRRGISYAQSQASIAAFAPNAVKIGVL
jgi:hypothetical protein